MIHLTGPANRPNVPVNRREMLRIGSLAVTGLSLPQLLATSSASESRGAGSRPAGFGKAKNCIILFQSGGASQVDTYDPKPDAPEEVRGEFGTIDTAIPGVRVTEHLPETARLLDRVSLIRTLTHNSAGHATGGYIMFTGHEYERTESEANFMGRQEYPHLGSALAKVSPGNGPMFPFVLVPRRLDAGSARRAGQWGGALGSKYDPMQTGGNPNDDNFRLDHLPLVANVPREVIDREVRLVEQLNRQSTFLEQTAAATALDVNRQKAIDVISSDAVRRAVDLASAEPAVRERYGRNLFGQSVLLGKRLLEAGTRLVQVNWLRTQGPRGYAWDSHRENFAALRDDLIPPFDQAFGALVSDLAETGLLDETLVVVAGEFGRTPKVTLTTAGREHWPHCFSVLLAGGGVRGGQLVGRSDSMGAYPAEHPVSPADLTATILHCLGVEPGTEVHDQLGRPLVMSKGKPIADVLG